VVRAAYYPNITIGGSAGLQSSTVSQWFTWPSRFWSIGPTISEQIFDAGIRRAENEQARAQYEGTVATYRQTVLAAFQAVEDELSSLRILSREIEQQHTAVDSSSHYLDLATTRFRTGVDSYLNVITAQNAVLSARETEVAIQLRQMTASVALVMALGGGWDTSQLPQVKDLSGKHAPVPGSQPPKGLQPPAAPNPPPLSAETPVPASSNARASVFEPPHGSQ
jgi:outer membrane protein TolC